MKEKNLSATAIEKALLVGGPTLAPYFRQMLTEKLGIPIDFSVDPLTVVARGAAIFAGTQRLDKTTRVKAEVGQFDVALSYNPVGADHDLSVAGEVSSPSNASVEGFTIEFVNRTTLWRSGKLPSTVKVDSGPACWPSPAIKIYSTSSLWTGRGVVKSAFQRNSPIQ